MCAPFIQIDGRQCIILREVAKNEYEVLRGTTKINVFHCSLGWGYVHDEVGFSKEWHINGKRHREEGPACEWADGIQEWWIDGEFIRRE